MPAFNYYDPDAWSNFTNSPPPPSFELASQDYLTSASKCGDQLRDAALRGLRTRVRQPLVLLYYICRGSSGT